MLVSKEAVDRDRRPSVAGFSINETVRVVSLDKVGRVVGTEGGLILVRLSEGDSPVPCAEGDLERRDALMG